MSVHDEPVKLRARSVEARVTRVSSATATVVVDSLAIEEPLEIRVAREVDGGSVETTLAITMRTPGDDFELAAGFLFSEGVVETRRDIEEMVVCGRNVAGAPTGNVVRFRLRRGVTFDAARLERNFYTSSACGVCGKTSIEALRSTRTLRVTSSGGVTQSVIHLLADRLRDAQPTFDTTGGLHAAALFDFEGRLQSIREDVGRHNAVDKVVGSEFLGGRVPLHNSLLMVSGRGSFELVQKAAMAGIPVMAAVGAPSSLAVDLAQSCGLTLLGFVREGRFNVYSGAERIDG
jgi:FdhD protein